MWLSGISRFLLKSARGEHYTTAGDELAFDELGFVHDRELMLVDHTGLFMSQRQDPLLARIGYRLADGGSIFFADSTPELFVPGNARTSESPLRAKLHKDSFLVQPVSEEADRWFSAFLGKPCRLVRRSENWKRSVKAGFGSPGDLVGFADGFPFHLLTDSSVALLSDKLGHPVPIINFRPNLIVSGAPAHAEDKWKRIRIGATELLVVKPCERCGIPATDQHTGDVDKNITKMLQSYRVNGRSLPYDRRIDEGAILFGQNLIHCQKRGSFAVGDQIEVLDYADEKCNS